jgi:hypothetical protein
MTKQRYIYSSLDVVLCLPLHIHDRVENVLKHVLFYVHDVKVIAKKIGLPIRKLSENTLLYPIVGQTKTKKVLLTGLETKHNASYFDTTSYNSSPERHEGEISFSTMPIKKSFS